MRIDSQTYVRRVQISSSRLISPSEAVKLVVLHMSRGGTSGVEMSPGLALGDEFIAKAGHLKRWSSHGNVDGVSVGERDAQRLCLDRPERDLCTFFLKNQKKYLTPNFFFLLDLRHLQVQHSPFP